MNRTSTPEAGQLRESGERRTPEGRKKGKRERKEKPIPTESRGKMFKEKVPRWAQIQGKKRGGDGLRELNFRGTKIP